MPKVRTRLSGPVLDARDAVELARFYAALLDWDVVEEESGPSGTWALVRPASRDRKLEFQSSPDYEPPVWPNAAGRQQMMVHLDIAVEDLEAGVAWAVELGATVAAHQPQPDVRVLLDPAGHPFCLFAGSV